MKTVNRAFSLKAKRTALSLVEGGSPAGDGFEEAASAVL